MSILLQSCIFHSALLSIAVSWTRSPFMALMFAVMLFINSSVILLSLGFEFLALVNMLVYVGALAVLFLFVIMLLEIPSAELRAYHRGWSSLALFGFLGITKTFFSDTGEHLIHLGKSIFIQGSFLGTQYGTYNETGFLSRGTKFLFFFEKEGAPSQVLSDPQDKLLTASTEICKFFPFPSNLAGFVPTLESLTFVGHAFYVRYADLLILNSLVLTVALFGALVLAHK